ncbi:MAG: hypothetical protein Q8P41_28950 [Pseudomonadota bacterium]|nr:hypothetical protein [Pseudomonadota bacterium]
MNVLFLIALPALAGTPDGETPAVESVCDDYSGAAGGICVAYCEATDCDADPNASETACDRLYDRFVDLTGDEPPCLSTDYAVELVYSADDIVTELYIDGVALADDGHHLGWSLESFQSLTLSSGTHTIAVRVDDIARSLAGLNMSVSVDGLETWVTGDSAWKVSDNAPMGAWTDVAYDDSTWTTPVVCPNGWGSPASLSTLNAGSSEWVWDDLTFGSCRPYDYTGGAYVVDATSWFRLTFTLP